MAQFSFTEETTSKYIETYLEHSAKYDYTQIIDGKFPIQTAFYKDLPNIEISGYPFASDYIDKDNNVYSVDKFSALPKEKQKECQLRFHYLPYSHELYIGTTGSGKTTGCVEPQIRAISSQKNKPNLFITDPKGELFEHNARHLIERGYKIYMLNFKDITGSDKWNPLLEMYDKKMSLQSIGCDCKIKQGMPPSSIRLSAKREEFNGIDYIEYDGRAFPNEDAFKYYLSFRVDCIESEISTLINQFANMLIKVQSKTDASWEIGAQLLLKGIVSCMLEDALDPKVNFTKDMMSIKTIQEYYLRLRNDLLSESTCSFSEHYLLKNKSAKTIAMLRVALDNAPRTMLSYCGVFDGATKDWFQGHIFALTTGNTINLDEIGNQPYAIFVITRDYEKSDFTVAGLFIDWAYRKALEKAEQSIKSTDGKPTTRPMHFILDEFGNIPEIRDFENKIATSRSRNIWFHLVVQSYEQLAIVYDHVGTPKSTVICDNCNAQIFLGAQSRETKEKFSKECGMRWVPSLSSQLDPQDTSMTEVAVLPISDLDLITPGEMYVKRLYMPVIKSQFIRSYICAANGDFENFNDTRAYTDFSPINMTPFTSDKFTFKKLKPDYDEDEDNDDEESDFFKKFKF